MSAQPGTPIGRYLSEILGTLLKDVSILMASHLRDAWKSFTNLLEESCSLQQMIGLDSSEESYFTVVNTKSRTHRVDLSEMIVFLYDTLTVARVRKSKSLLIIRPLCSVGKGIIDNKFRSRLLRTHPGKRVPKVEQPVRSLI